MMGDFQASMGGDFGYTPDNFGGGGTANAGVKGSNGKAATVLPSPTILYVNICRTVMNADPDDPSALDELNDFMPFLRYGTTN